MDREKPLQVWVMDSRVNAGTLERLGDARQAADRLGSNVAVLLVGADSFDTNQLVASGADHVYVVNVPADAGHATRIAAAKQVIFSHQPRLILAAGDAHGREWAAGIAAECEFTLISPALLITVRGKELDITGLDHSGGMARRVRIGAEQAVVVTLRDGVGEAMPADSAQHGEVVNISVDLVPEPVHIERVIPADPATVDIRYADRLVAGGRGLGGKEGFDVLRRFAEKIHAGVAASRMAVDLGWIEHARQVGQTGKTVQPNLYIACGISGASHHLEGMSTAKHIVAINNDPNAPIFKTAHLALVADLYEVLRQAEEGLKS